MSDIILDPILFERVDASGFDAVYQHARSRSERVAAATSPYVHDRDALHVLSIDGLSGFVIRPDGELTNVFSTVKGRGDALLRTAVLLGASYLDCFDGYLPTLYARHGFREVQRVPNWTAGDPDVVYMALPGYAHRHGCDEPS